MVKLCDNPVSRCPYFNTKTVCNDSSYWIWYDKSCYMYHVSSINGISNSLVFSVLVKFCQISMHGTIANVKLLNQFNKCQLFVSGQCITDWCHYFRAILFSFFCDLPLFKCCLGHQKIDPIIWTQLSCLLNIPFSSPQSFSGPLLVFFRDHDKTMIAWISSQSYGDVFLLLVLVTQQNEYWYLKNAKCKCRQTVTWLSFILYCY